MAQTQAADGPLPGVRATGIQLLFDQAQATAVVLQHFAIQDDMEEGARVFSAMDSG